MNVDQLRRLLALGTWILCASTILCADDAPQASPAQDPSEVEAALRRRVQTLENEVRTLKKRIQELERAPQKISRESWVERVTSLRHHNTAAFMVGPELTVLDPEEGLAIVQAAWPQIAVDDVKTGLLKAFHFGKDLRPKKHQKVLDVLHLGMTDPSDAVKEYASAYLREFAFVDFSAEPQRYAAWYRTYGGQVPEEVILLNQSHVPDGIKSLVDEIAEASGKREMARLGKLAGKIGEMPHPYAIPTLIGVIEADNSYDTVYGVGYFGLRRMTDVDYSPFHDGPWWRRWWMQNKHRFPKEVQDLPIPEFPRTEYGKTHRPYPDDVDTLAGKLRLIPRLFVAGDRSWPDLSDLAQEIAEHEDPSAIPYLIGLIEADNTYDTVYGVGYFGLAGLTGVSYDEKHDGAWWRKWWEDNMTRYPTEAQQAAIPDYRKLVAERDRAREQDQRRDALQDVADIPAQDLLVGDDEKKRYFLIGPREGVAAPKDGYKLVIVMPGGDGGPDFHPFVRRIYKHALNDSFLIAQPVAFKWQPDQKVVWPTRSSPVDEQQFATEDFVEDVVRDVRRKYPLNARHIFTLSWSSSGPAAYAISLAENKSVTGSYVAMSVFKPNYLPPLRFADGHVYFIDHSPEDRVCPFRMAETASQSLEENSATIRFNTYVGGHGWHGNVYGRIRSGIEWLEKQTAAVQNIEAP